ncbi:MAG: hypothetical protein AAGB11_08310 [Pseudomonadota bacterium]
MRGLTLTLLAAIVPLVAAAMVLGAYLNFASVRNHYLDIVGERLETASHRVAEDAQTALSLGLPLLGQVALADNLAREMGADDVIGSLIVVDAAGLILFADDPLAVGGNLDGRVEPEVVRQTTILSPIGTPAGAVVAGTNDRVVQGAIDTLASDIFRGAGVALSTGLFAIIGLVAFTVRALWGRVTLQGSTKRGQRVPAEVAPLIDRLDAAHAAIGERLRADGAGS